MTSDEEAAACQVATPSLDKVLHVLNTLREDGVYGNFQVWKSATE